MKQIEVPVDLVRTGVQIGTEAAAICEKVAADLSARTLKAPHVVDALIERGIINVLDKQATIDLLLDPVAPLDMIERLSKMATTPRAMGAAVKTANSEDYDPRFPPEKESDRVFFDKMSSMG